MTALADALEEAWSVESLAAVTLADPDVLRQILTEAVDRGELVLVKSGDLERYIPGHLIPEETP